MGFIFRKNKNRVTFAGSAITARDDGDRAPPLAWRRAWLGYSSVIGLLFRYADGSQACVGEFRFYLITPALRVDGRQPFYLGFAMAGSLPYIAAVHTSPPTPSEGMALDVRE
ncbi:hypothetical protein VTI74DRAFT_6093 [Chaetomium olivicolor]